jgi:serralysin
VILCSDLYDSAGTFVTGNDDGGPRFNSLLTFTATTTGTYYIASDSFNNAYTGEYLLTMNTGSTPYMPEVGVQDIADYLTHAYWLNPVGGTPRQWNATTVTYNVQGLTAERGRTCQAGVRDLVRPDQHEFRRDVRPGKYHRR